MRSVLKRSLFIAGAALLVAGSTAYAASNVAEVKVPFPFVVNGHEFDPGTYAIQRDINFPSALWIRGEHGNHEATVVEVNPASGHDPSGTQAALTFTPYENQHRLWNVWQSDMRGWSVAGR